MSSFISIFGGGFFGIFYYSIIVFFRLIYPLHLKLRFLTNREFYFLYPWPIENRYVVNGLKN